MTCDPSWTALRLESELIMRSERVLEGTGPHRLEQPYP